MSFLKRGPEIKLSGIKVPGFLEDVYYDLKDRHLLPVAAILLVGIVAVPIAISGSSDSEEFAPREPGATQSAVDPTADELVAESAPGLRDYRRRLDGKGAIDPFRAPPKESSGSSGAGGGSESAGSSGSTESSSSTESSGSTTYAPSESGGGGTTTKSGLTHYSYAIDVRISGGSGDKKESTVRKNLPALTMLPSRETPAIVYMGSTKDGKKAVMTVSSDVQSIFGDAKCVLGSETCQMLVMETGLPETFVYGGAEKTYTIELLKIELVESDKLNKAALGNPKKGGKGGERKSGRAMAVEASDGDQG